VQDHEGHLGEEGGEGEKIISETEAFYNLMLYNLLLCDLRRKMIHNI